MRIAYALLITRAPSASSIHTSVVTLIAIICETRTSTFPTAKQSEIDRVQTQHCNVPMVRAILFANKSACAAAAVTFCRQLPTLHSTTTTAAASPARRPGCKKHARNVYAQINYSMHASVKHKARMVWASCALCIRTKTTTKKT